MTQHYKNLILSFLAMTVLISAHAQVDTISISKGDLVTANLKPGLHQYLVYFENPKKQRLASPSIWNRQVNFKTWNGKDVIEIVQNWYNADTTFNRYVYSISNRNNFEPIYHYTKSSRGIEAFDFENGKISGSDSVSANAKKDLDVNLITPTLNWELDMETFNTLPFKKVGQRFLINFYHPGGTPPKYYEYKIIGTEKISATENVSIDCWQLKINYTENDWAIFWISIKSKEMIKMQEHFRGGYRYKIRFLTPMPLIKS